MPGTFPVPRVGDDGKLPAEFIPDPADIGAATPADLAAGLSTKVNTSTYTSGLAAKQDAATLPADVASHVADGSALATALGAALVTPDAAKLLKSRVNLFGRPTATRNCAFERFLTDAGRSCRIRHVATVDMTDIVLTYGNYGDQDGEPNSPIKVRASIEFPSGTYRKVHFPGEDVNRDVTIMPGGIVSASPLARPLKAGDVFYTNTLVVPVNAGGQYPAGGLVINVNTVTDERCTPNSTTDYTTTANPGVASTQYGYGPIAICGTPASIEPVIAGVGDSIVAGTGDAVLNNRYENGFFIRAMLDAGLAYLMLGKNGEAASNWNPADTAADRHRYRSLLTAAADIVVQEHGTNDFGNSNRTFAQTRDLLIASWDAISRRGPKVWQTTITPRTTSTDAWATTANQVPFNARFGPEANSTTATSDRQQLNAWLRDRAPLTASTLVAAATGTSGAGVVRAGQAGHPLTGVADVAATVEVWEPTTSSWVYRAGWTTDGIHPTSSGHIVMADALRTALGV